MSYAPLELKHTVLHSEIYTPNMSIGVKSLLKKSRKPQLKYSFRCAPGNSSNLLQHVFHYIEGSKDEERLLMRRVQCLLRLKHFTLMSILKHKVCSKKQEITFIVPKYHGIYLSEHVFIASQNKFYLHEEELWAILGQLLLFCIYLLNEDLHIAETISNHLSIQHLYYVSSLPHMEDSRGCIKINLLELLLRESVSLDETMRVGSECTSNAFVQHDIMHRLLVRVHTIMSTLIGLQATAHAPMGLPPSLMTPVHMNRVLSTMFNKRTQRHISEFTYLLTQPDSENFSDVDLRRTCSYARSKQTHSRPPFKGFDELICMVSDLHTDESSMGSDTKETSFVYKAKPLLAASEDVDSKPSIGGKTRTLATGLCIKDVMASSTHTPRHALTHDSSNSTPNAPSCSLYMESVLGVGDLSMIDTEYNFSVPCSLSQLQQTSITDKYSLEVHNAVDMLQTVDSVHEMYRIVPLAKVVDQLELLYADNDKVRKASLRYAIITDNVPAVKRLVRKLPLNERSTLSEISYSIRSYYTTELMMATTIRNHTIIRAITPYQSNLLILNMGSARSNALLMAIQNYLLGDTIAYIARHSRPILEKHWDSIVMQACLAKSPEMITTLAPFKCGTGSLYFTKVCVLLGLREVAVNVFPIEQDAIEQDNGMSILKEILFDREAIVNRKHDDAQPIETTKDGYTRFIFAASLGDLELCQACRHEAGTITELYDSAYLRSLQNRHMNIIQYLDGLAEALPEVIPQSDPQFYTDKDKKITQLMSAAATHNIPKMRQYFSQAGHKNIVSMTALMFSCDNENIEGAMILIPKEAGERCNATVWFSGFEFSGASALMFAVANNNLTLVKMLARLEMGLQDRNGRTALMAAARFGNLSIIRVLSPLEAGIRDKKGKCAIHYAVEYRQHEAAILLAYFEGLCQDKSGLTAVNYCLRIKDYDLANAVEYISTHVTQPEPKTGIPYQETSPSDSVDLKVHLGTALTTISMTSLPSLTTPIIEKN